jgi:hypothetical protein
MTLEQFLSRYTGLSVLYNTADENLTGQCVQLVCFYATQVVGSPVMWANAVQWWDNFNLGDWYTRVPYPGNTPLRGDIVVFNGDTPGSAGYGHISICIEDGERFTFDSFDSNWGGKFAHVVTHDYKYVKGFLRPKVSIDMKNTHPYNEGDAETVAELVGRDFKETNSKVDWNDVFYAILKPVIVGLQAQVSELTTANTLINNENSKLRAQLGDSNLTVKQAIRVLASTIKDALSGK